MQCIYHCPLPLPPPTRPLCACKMCSNKTICKFCNNISFYGCRFCYYSTYTAAFFPSSTAANRVCSSFTSSVLGLGQSLTPCSPSVQYIWVSPEPHELFIVKSWAKTGREERPDQEIDNGEIFYLSRSTVTVALSPSCGVTGTNAVAACIRQGKCVC